MKTKRQFTREFKLSVLRELENGKTMAQLSREHTIQPTMISKWRRQYNESPGIAFSGRGNISTLQAKVAEYERIIGRLHIEKEFLKKALSALETRLAEIRKQGGRQ